MKAIRVCLFLLTLLATFFVSSESRAYVHERAAFAVVIGNNRSLGSRRPDLHYADDDAAKYFAILETVAPDAVSLLADFDDDTARLFPDARQHAAAPTRAELLKVGRELSSRVQAATSAGKETDLYFVFAGHGDVDAGMGFLELADARFTASDLEGWLRAIPFTRAHVILDSCNSFFMIGERKPGGHYYATYEDAARSLSTRLPNVGVFLSTSAEGESFEWSEIQSGIFSHVVRSGLLGAADADGDGRVSYLELAAFVATATADVKNPNMRPHVFARGPGGRDGEAILDERGRTGARSFRLTDAAPMRVRLRDRESVPILDANEEGGTPLVLTLPLSWTLGAVLERKEPGAAVNALATYAVPDAPSVLTLASLEPIAPRGAVRGPAEIFSSLFMRPFGPRAVASFESASDDETPQVYGVSQEDAERMRLLLSQIEASERSQRVLGGWASVGGAALLGVTGVSLLADAKQLDPSSPSSANLGGAVLLGTGALFGGLGAYFLADPFTGERAAMDYRAALASDGDYARAFAAAESRLHQLAAREDRRRWAARGLGAALVAGSVAWLVCNEVLVKGPTDRLLGRVDGSAILLAGAFSIGASYLMETPEERLMTIWERDPGMQHLQPNLAPVVAPVHGGVTMGLVGTF
jgi:hypothetical protein